MQPVTVVFTDPNASPYASSTANYTIKALIDNVGTANDVTAIWDGQATTAFTFTSHNKQFSLPVTMSEGTHTLVLSGTNALGTVSATQVISYTTNQVDEPTAPPVVNFLKPNVNPKAVSNAIYDFTVFVDHVDGPSDITMTVNGTSVTNFTYSLQSKLLAVVPATCYGS